MITINFKFDPELPEDWHLSADELEAYFIDLPINDKYTFAEMKNAYKNGVPTEDLTCRVMDLPCGKQVIYSSIGGDKDRLIWAKWRVAVAIAIAEKYDTTLCGIDYDGNNFQIWELFGVNWYLK